MAPQASWPRDMPDASLESGNLGIWECGNLKLKKSKIWQIFVATHAEISQHLLTFQPVV